MQWRSLIFVECAATSRLYILRLGFVAGIETISRCAFSRSSSGRLFTYLHSRQHILYVAVDTLHGFDAAWRHEHVIRASIILPLFIESFHFETVSAHPVHNLQLIVQAF